ncbi:MAG: metalloregulator ArsR/SmtB family transcription factor [Candidatus Omnitrophica bacterium]|nr:metalloregulator ArsR/SmtB family transcription factor [Candidatus Omnitrophota bacterium]MDD5488923.1 metalloregulator ArsR/SmtB family transcription factor [Candidatus Omnitrophota bacterium]
MKIRKARQILKSFADDTRLRIIHLLKNTREMNVTELCDALGKKQSNISKHLTRLRLTGVVRDRREGNLVKYFLAKPATNAHRELLNAIIKGLSDVEVFKEDLKRTGLKKQKITGGKK